MLPLELQFIESRTIAGRAHLACFPLEQDLIEKPHIIESHTTMPVCNTVGTTRFVTGSHSLNISQHGIDISVLLSLTKNKKITTSLCL